MPMCNEHRFDDASRAVLLEAMSLSRSISRNVVVAPESSAVRRAASANGWLALVESTYSEAAPRQLAPAAQKRTAERR